MSLICDEAKGCRDGTPERGIFVEYVREKRAKRYLPRHRNDETSVGSWFL